ncbi:MULTISPECIES: hypothetical protein [unclassified Nocardiopsis]|uniref:hypothetical protein n=1 Tax=unclassified Nocardiopsis TaxID=2649073 RepID=UPI00135BAF19|nr:MULTISPECIES: hypothetical protein [unclassified Nocardiopsis]
MRVRTVILTVAAAFTLASLASSPALADDGDGSKPPLPCEAPLVCTDSGNWPK